MSKYVKNLVTDHVRERLDGVNDALLVNVIGMDANANNRLRGALEDKNINLLVVKNSLAARATAEHWTWSTYERNITAVFRDIGRRGKPRTTESGGAERSL